MNDHKLLDKMLTFINSEGFSDSKDISEKFTLSHERTLELLHILDNDGNILLNSPSNSTSLIQNFNASSKGRAFMARGGYTALQNEKSSKNRKKTFSDIITIVLSLAALYFAYAQNKLADKTDILELNNQQLQNQIDSIKSNPISVIHDTVIVNNKTKR